MPSTEGVAIWIQQLRAGNTGAAQPLWERYFQRLVALARQKLQGTPRRAADEEDVALSAFDSFCRGVAQGRFPRLGDGENLWELLVVITVRKALDLRARENCQKRGAGKVGGESTLEDLLGIALEEPGLDQFMGDEPTPDLAAQVAEEFRLRLDQLTRPELRSIALWKMEGYTNAEIADRLGCAKATVERRLGLIRSLWRQREE